MQPGRAICACRGGLRRHRSFVRVWPRVGSPVAAHGPWDGLDPRARLAWRIHISTSLC